jgi:hypothetical protein
VGAKTSDSKTDKHLKNNKMYAHGEAIHQPAHPDQQAIQSSNHVAVDVDTGKLEEVSYPGDMGSFA